jgi:peptide-methionine (R)-S-oxide reductase
MFYKITLCVFALSFLSCNSKAQQNEEKPEYAVVKTEAQWKAELSDLEYYVLRQAGTEKAFSSPLDKNYSPGAYHCRGCGVLLYESEFKFDSGTGWPSFDRGVNENLEFDVDYKIGYARTELKCSNCGSHLGHKFDDGPRNTTGKRHCINGAALTFKPNKND